MLLHPRGVAASGFPPLCNIPHCCLPQESGPCLSPSVAVRPLRPATDRRLGGPLPRQQANRTRAHRAPSGSPRAFPAGPCGPPGICGISGRFRPLSPCARQVAHALLTRPPLAAPSLGFRRGPFDLHVLGTPPAFILSQDQTLMLLLSFPRPGSALLPSGRPFSRGLFSYHCLGFLRGTSVPRPSSEILSGRIRCASGCCAAPCFGIFRSALLFVCQGAGASPSPPGLWTLVASCCSLSSAATSSCYHSFFSLSTAFFIFFNLSCSYSIFSFQTCF